MVFADFVNTFRRAIGALFPSLAKVNERALGEGGRRIRVAAGVAGHAKLFEYPSQGKAFPLFDLSQEELNTLYSSLNRPYGGLNIAEETLGHSHALDVVFTARKAIDSVIVKGLVRLPNLTKEQQDMLRAADRGNALLVHGNMGKEVAKFELRYFVRRPAGNPTLQLSPDVAIDAKDQLVWGPYIRAAGVDIARTLNQLHGNKVTMPSGWLLL